MMVDQVKEGNFDWIVDYDSLSEFFTEEYIGISEERRKTFNVLVIGCGTSTLSHCLVEKASFGHIVSIDNDIAVINHMKNLHKDDKRLSWYTYDILSYDNTSSSRLCLASSYDIEHHFDLIIDKGTLDAILVEGQVYTMLANIYRLLKHSGIYFVCSLFSMDVISSLLCTPALGLTVANYHTKHDVITDHDMIIGNIFICSKKSADFIVDMEVLRAEETQLMNDHYQSTCPLLSYDDEMVIIQSFGDNDRSYLALEQAYNIMFVGREILGYGLDLFYEDLQDFTLTHDGMMNAAEAILFLQTKQ